MSDERTLSRLVVVGASHRTSSETTRDRLFISEEDLPGFLISLRKAGFTDVVALSTCARTEVFGLAPDKKVARAGAIGALATLGGFDVDEIGSQTYYHETEEALRHLFRVSASLDSPIVGEPEVTGQFRDAVRIAGDGNFLGRQLDTIVQAANRTAKRVRSETAIGQRPVSMAACAVQVARDVQGDLSRVRALLVTGGEMGELIADQMRDAGLSQLTVIARSRARAEMSARRYDCHFSVLDDLPEILAEADIVITSLGAGQHLFDRENVSEALVARRRRPMLFIDAAIPSDVDPLVNDLEDAFAYSLDDLERIALEGRFQRDEAATEAEAIIETELREYVRAVAERGAVPAVSELRQHFEHVRQDILSDMGGDDPAVDEATRRLANRLLHYPSETLRKMAAEDPAAGRDAEEMVNRLFGLSGEESEKKE